MLGKQAIVAIAGFVLAASAAVISLAHLDGAGAARFASIAALIVLALICATIIAVESVREAKRGAREREHLTDALNASLGAVEASRRRLETVAAQERRRIERDLHDGAQQQLVALRIRLELAREQIERDPERGVELLGELGPAIDEAIEEVRSLAHGIYPSLLADAGLEEALRAAARHGEVPTEVTVASDGITRYPLEIEAAVYFCCVEALQNTAKHASAEHVWVKVSNGAGELKFEVRDDGLGFDVGTNGHRGAGITNQSDRISALGGSFTVTSKPGSGTLVAGSVPVPPD